ncbi:MAG TPA: UDP-2,3-diacylglucosamine diphosphatase [Burkholderiales bacterium]|nr:UDP-2,3-diacylglucosamine diphosphatase [Burkholderiales bacterium]
MPGYTVFLSDLHLSPTHSKPRAAFFEFLDTAGRDADAIYILGDLFEHWAGDDDLGNKFNAEVAFRLQNVARHVPVHIIVGNRDFLLSKKFERASGARLLPDPAVIDLYGTRTLLMHGDLLCTQDRRYQRFRKLVRNRLVQALFLTLPLAKRQQIIGGARRMSEGEKQAKQMTIMDVTTEAVELAFVRHGCTRLIHGHTHRPARHEHHVNGRLCERWVLSDWHRCGQYLKISARGCQPVALPFR